VREANFPLPKGSWSSYTWWKRGLPEGIEFLRVYEMRNGDGRAFLSTDGNWNHDPMPVHPPATYDEVVRRLSRCAICPPIHGIQINGEWCLSFGILREPEVPPPWEPWEE
jgi:hypothetical protein